MSVQQAKAAPAHFLLNGKEVVVIQVQGGMEISSVPDPGTE